MSIEKLMLEIVELASVTSMGNLARLSFTLNGRINEQDALQGMNAFERVLYDGLAFDGTPEEGSDSGVEVVLAFRPHGRAFFLESKFAGDNEGHLRIVRRVEVSRKLHGAAQEAAKAEYAALESRRTEIQAYLDEHGVQSIVNVLKESAEHMAPLLFYVGAQCFSNFYQIGHSDYSAERAVSAALTEVSECGPFAGIEALTLTYCMALLRSSGTFTRLEEMNSSQLQVPAVARHFSSLARRYQMLCELSDADLLSFDRSTLQQQALTLAVWREQALNYGRFVRDINGLSLNKKERFIRHWSLDAATRKLSERAQSIALIEDALHGSEAVERVISAENIGEWLRHGEPDGVGRGFAFAIEHVIDAVVRKAVEVTRSDVGMTRGTRSFSRLIKLLDAGDTVEACNLTQADYFCHPVPGAELESTLPPRGLLTLLNAVSSRMRYNTWHYAPSYFDIAAIPAERGWFNAPRMADLAQWSDQHHTGHVHASVRYSIRSPQPVRVGSRVLPGLVDLRLMRQTGESYSMVELGTAIAYTEALGLIYQALMDHVLAGNSPDFAFDFGDKRSIEKIYLNATSVA
jgi:hypothetical protein